MEDTSVSPVAQRWNLCPRCPEAPSGSLCPSTSYSYSLRLPPRHSYGHHFAHHSCLITYRFSKGWKLQAERKGQGARAPKVNSGDSHRLRVNVSLFPSPGIALACKMTSVLLALCPQLYPGPCPAAYPAVSLSSSCACPAPSVGFFLPPQRLHLLPNTSWPLWSVLPWSQLQKRILFPPPSPSLGKFPYSWCKTLYIDLTLSMELQL